MTVNYSLQLSNSKPWALFRILLKWHGSIWKLVLIEFFIFLLSFLLINILLNNVLSKSMQKCVFLKTLKMIPIEFMLGFFVQAIITRWQKMIQNIGFIDRFVSLYLFYNYVRGNTDYSRMLRRNIVRYICLAQVLASRNISTAVRKRFPTIESIAEAGKNIILRCIQSFLYNNLTLNSDLGSKLWIPVQWALSIVYRARQEQLIESDYFCDRICEEIRNFRNSLGTLCKFDWVPLPLAYPQLVYLAVHVHFLITVISRQVIIEDDKAHIINITTKVTVQFFFYMAWTKVAMVLINPFGEDDDDFETNALIDRNFKFGMRIADVTTNDTPWQLKDSFWNHDVESLCNEESSKANQDGSMGSTVRFR
ncbi:unnamed protein product [Thelazia callipaeda]|uniref:Bestrophin homolog n=1 Tax=Thelazia callipaeda TaxID=103827 RepID=A0A0N5DAY7_THECL|nr:unnamed protein product [Thelazia callipaeda]